jgi:hypothetical protein
MSNANTPPQTAPPPIGQPGDDFIRWFNGAPEWKSLPAKQTLESAFKAGVFWEVWFNDARGYAAATDAQLFVHLVDAAYFHGWKILLSRLVGIKLAVATPSDLRGWCLFQHWMVQHRDRLETSQLTFRGDWLDDDDLISSWTRADMQFVSDMVDMERHLRAGQLAEANSIASRYPTGLKDTRPNAIQAEAIQMYGRLCPKIRAVGWNMMRHLGGHLRPAEPEDPATWQTAHRDLDSIEAWCDQEETRLNILMPSAGAPPTRYSTAATVNGAVQLVTIGQISILVHLSERSMSPYVKDWGDPVEKKRGRRPARYDYAKILPKLRERFPDAPELPYPQP